MSFLRTLGQTLEKRFGEAYRNACGHRRYGLRYEDLLTDTYDVQAALKRLPEAEMEARNRRIKIAFDLSLKGKTLPAEQWTKPEEDLPYLRKYLNEVISERKEREAFRK